MSIPARIQWLPGLGRFVAGLLFVLLAATALRPIAIAGATTYYVRTDGTGDCSSWSNACGLQDALVAAGAGGEIWVAAGIYKPTTGTDRTASFALKEGVAIYGGFAGTEVDLAGRDPARRVTVLSGDIDSNDAVDGNGVTTTAAGIAGDNSYHVVTASSVGATAILDGFTVTAGRANGTGWAQAEGGGLFLNAASPTLRGLVIQGNAAGDGGGLADSFASGASLTGVLFRQNAAAATGGGMWVREGTAELTNVAFLTNSSGSHGGGLAVGNAQSATLVNVTFAANQAGGFGGGLYNGGATSVANSIFWGNTDSSTWASIFPGPSTTVTFSDVEQATGVQEGSGNINADPRFLSTTDLRLRSGSPAIDTGSNAAVPSGVTTDLAGRPRIMNGTVDMGANEGGIFIVNSADDVVDGACNATHCSLRDAITAANASANAGAPDVIGFNIPGAGPHTIHLSSALPSISEAVVIDGYSQPGAQPADPQSAATLKIALDGTSAGSTTRGLLLAGSGGSTVRGLAIGGFRNGGIETQTGSNGNRIEGNHVGTDVAGAAAATNTAQGVYLHSNSNVLGGMTPAARNVISGNHGGVVVAGSGNVVQGNYIGINAAGTAAIGNAGPGLMAF